MSLFLSIKNRFLKWGKPAADTLVNALSGLDTRVTALEAGGGGSSVTVLECTEADGVYTIPMKAGALYDAVLNSVVVLKFSALYEGAVVPIIFHEVLCFAHFYDDPDDPKNYKFGTYNAYEISAATGDDYPTFSLS